MPTTTLRNCTEGVVNLREGHSGVLQKVCDIGAGKEYKVHSNITATYKEYWCALQPGNDQNQFILTSDDCSDWKVIEITSTGTQPQKFEWKGTVPAKGNAAQPDTSPSSSAPPPGFSFVWRWLSKFPWLKKPTSSTAPAPPPESSSTPAGSTETPPTGSSETPPTVQSPAPAAPTVPPPNAPVTAPLAAPTVP